MTRNFQQMPAGHASPMSKLFMAACLPVSGGADE
jgi:hypothetical protein